MADHGWFTPKNWHASLVNGRISGTKPAQTYSLCFCFAKLGLVRQHAKTSFWAKLATHDALVALVAAIGCVWRSLTLCSNLLLVTHLFRPLFRFAQGIYSLCKTSFKQLPLCHELPAWLKFSAPIPIPIPQTPHAIPNPHPQPPMAKPWCQVIGNEVAVIHGGLPCLAQDDSAKPGEMIPVGSSGYGSKPVITSFTFIYNIVRGWAFTSLDTLKMIIGGVRNFGNPSYHPS